MDKNQAEQEIKRVLDEIIPQIRLIPSSSSFGGSVAELKWQNNTRYLPILDGSISRSSSNVR